MGKSSKKTKNEALYRGDARDQITPPDPAASVKLVRHILYFEGPGRASPYLSNSESREFAARFAGADGRVWEADLSATNAGGVRHVPKGELLQLLQGTGKGRASWPRAYEVALARRYVEEWQEHLLDFSALRSLSQDEIATLLENVYGGAQ